ncbi:MAG: hypothetical protein JOY51_00845 [Nevskia sp.]|nr:hypothetical protein [Nevskia sp.]
MIAATCLACASAAALAAYRFEASDVLDLSTEDHLAPLAKTDAPAPVALAADAAKAILAAPEVGNDAPGQIPMLDGTDKQARKQEQARLAAEAASVQRAGKTLTIKTQSGAPVLFIDRQAPQRSDADADGELFVYAGRLGAARYQRVEERFQQDAPGSYLVGPAGGKSLFIPNGSYIEQLSPDGKWLLSMSAGDTHALLVLMALDADGPRLALLCRGGGGGKAGPAQFKGWHGADSFDLVLSPVGAGQQGVLETIPVRFALDAQGWHPATPNPVAFERLDYACRR